jgi:hypothetical protein
MAATTKDNATILQNELLGATLRYCAVADWFESHPCAWHKHMSLAEAMNVFNRAESDVRRLGARLLRGGGHRNLLLAAAGVPEEAR